MKAYFKKGKVLSVMVACCIMFFATLGAIIFNDGNINTNNYVDSVSASIVEDVGGVGSDEERVEPNAVQLKPFLNRDWKTIAAQNLDLVNYGVESVHFVSGTSLPDGYVSNKYFVVGLTTSTGSLVNDTLRAYWLKTTGESGGQVYKLAIVSTVDVNICAPADSSGLFENTGGANGKGFSALRTIVFDNFDTTSATTMKNMFKNCSNLQSLDLSGFNTAAVINMSYMFYHCENLTSVGDLSGWNTGSVTDMSYMFYNCKSLRRLDNMFIDVSKVTNMNAMFRDCQSLKTVNTTVWYANSLTNTNYMFYNCTSLLELNISNFAVSKLTSDATGMLEFGSTNKIRMLYLPKTFGSKNLQILTGSNLYYVGTTNKVITADVRTYLTSENVGDVLYASFLNKDVVDIVEDSLGIYRSSIKTIHFVKGTTLPTGYNSNQYVPVGATYIGNTGSGTGGTVVDVVRAYWKKDAENSYHLAVMSLDGEIWVQRGLYNAFCDMSGLTSIKFDSFNTSLLANMSNMFKGCSNLQSLDLSGWDTSLVTNMESLFESCSALRSIAGLNNWNTSSLNYMSWMFEDCTSLENLDLSSWDGSSIIYMFRVFENCSNLKSIIGLNNVNSGPTMTNMFKGCSSLENLDLSGWDTSKATSMSEMFSGCSSLTSLNLSGWDTSKVTTMYNMFYNCSSLTSLDLSGWDTSSVKNMGNMFSDCLSLTSLNLTGNNWNTSSVTSMYGVFESCSSLKNLDLSGWDTSKATSMSEMFYGCSSLTSLNLSNFNTSQVKDMKRMFYKCSSLTSLNLSGWDTSQVTDMIYMFSDCSSLTSLNLTGDNWNTSSVTNMFGVFDNCSSLENLDLSGWDTSKVTDMSYMFNGCSKLKEIKGVSQFNTSSVTTMFYMFSGCSSLTSLDLSGWDTSSVTTMGDMFNKCSELTMVGNLSGWNTSKVTKMSYMFEGCFKLKNLDLSGWDTSKVTDMKFMFYCCYALKELNVSNFELTSGVNTTNAFALYTAGGTNTINKIWLPKTFGSNVVIRLYTGSTLYVSGTQTKLVTGGTAKDIDYNYQGKILVTINVLTVDAKSGSISTTTGWSISGDKATANVEYGTSVTLPSVSRSGFTFNGWNTTADGTGTAYNNGANVTPSSSFTLYARWTQNTATIKLGTLTNVSKVYYGTTPSIAQAQTNELTTTGFVANSNTNYYFYAVLSTETGHTTTFSGWSGWFSNDNNQTSSAYSFTSGGPFTINASANKTANNYTITYSGNYNTGGSTSPTTGAYGSSVTIRENGFTRSYTVTYNYNYSGSTSTTATANYTFAGWKNSGGTAYASGGTVTISGDLTLYAQWTSASVQLPIPTRTGYDFGGWYTNASLTTFAGNGGANLTPTSNITLYAKWTNNSNDITYYAGTGTITANSDYYAGSGSVAKKSVTYGTSYSNLIAPSSSLISKTGYTFGGFYVGNDFKNNNHNTDYLRTAKTLRLMSANGTISNNHFTVGMVIGVDVTISGAKITGIEVNDIGVNLYEYSINNDKNRIVAYITVQAGQLHDNYSFVDVLVQNNGNFTVVVNEFWTSTMSTQLIGTDGKLISSVSGYTGSSRTWQGSSNVTAVAKWTPNTYTVAYNANGGSGTMSNPSHTYDTAKALTANAFTRTGYTFAGWATSASGSVAYADKASVKNLTSTANGTVTLYAIWTANTYYVQYSANGGNGSMDNSEHKYGTSSKLRKNTFTRTGYTFNGWNTKADGTGTTNCSDEQSISTLTSTANGTVTLYAKWTANTYTVTYNANGGSGTMTSTTVTYGQPYTVPVYPFTRTGYTFSHWYDYGNSTSWETYNEKTITWNLTTGITLTAIWTANKVGLSLDAGDYIYVNYIEATGTQYIDTGVKINSDVSAEFKFEFTSFTHPAANNEAYVFGGDVYPYPFVGTISGGFRLCPGNGIFTTWGLDLNTHVVNYSSTAIKFDGTTKATGSSTYSSEIYNYYLFAGNDEGGANFFTNSKVYYLKMYNKGTLIRDMVPAIRKSDNKVGMHDRVEDVFYENKGSGTFEYGLKQVAYDQQYGELPTAAKKGYTFTGWYTQANGGTKVETTTTASAADKIYAQYTRNKSTIKLGTTTLVTNGTSGTTDEIKVYHGTSIDDAQLKKNELTTTGFTANSNTEYYFYADLPTEAGYTISFGAWSGWFSGTDQTIKASSFVVDGNTFTINLSANKTSNVYKVTLDNQGATTAGTTAYWYRYKFAPGNIFYFTDSTLTNPMGNDSYTITIPTKTGYKFKGYDDSQDGDGTLYVNEYGTCVNNIFENYSRDVTLYARWETDSYLVTATANGGKISSTANWVGEGSAVTQNVRNNSAYVQLPTVEREGYTLSSWLINYAPTISSSNYTAQMYQNRTSYEFKTDSVYGSYIRVNGYQSNSSIDTAFLVGSSSAFRVTAGKTYKFGFFVRADNTVSAHYINNSTSGYNTMVTWSNEAITYSPLIEFKNDGNWYYISFEVTAPSGVTTAQLQIGNDYPNLYGIGSYIDFACISFTEVGASVSNSSIVTFEHSIIANWSPKTVTITPDLNGGTGSSSKNVSYNSNYGAASLTNPTKTGYTFAGWEYVSSASYTYRFVDYIESTGTQWIDTQYPNKSANIKTHVKFSYTQLTGYGTIIGAQVGSNNFLIRQQPDGNLWMYPYGTSGLQAVALNTVYDMILTLNNGSWSTNINGTAKNGSYSTTHVNNLNIALFNSGYTDSSGKKYGGQADSQILAKARIYECQIWDSGTLVRDLRPCVRADGTVGMFDLVNNRFYSNIGTGNFTASSTLVNVPISSTTPILSDSNHTLKATWTPNSYTVQYNANGGSGTMSPSSCTYGTASKLAANAFTRTGYTFDGWNTKADGTGTSYSNEQNVSTLAESGTITLYAKWKANNYTLTYDVYGGTVSPTSKTVTYDSVYGSMPTPTKTGYTFDGWGIQRATSVGQNTRVSADGLTVSNNSANVDTFFYIKDLNNNDLSLVIGKTYRLSFYCSISNNAVWKMAPQNNDYYSFYLKDGFNTIEFIACENRAFLDDRLRNISVSWTISGITLEEVGNPSITAATKVDQLGNHTLFAQWTPNKYEVKMVSDEYIFVDYIESNASKQYINTEYKLKNTDTLIVDMMVRQNDGGYVEFGFCGTNAINSMYSIKGKFVYGDNSGFYYVEDDNATVTLNKRHHIVVCGNNYIVNGLKTSMNRTFTNFNNLDLYLFAYNYNGSASCHSPATRMYGVQIIDSTGKLVRDMIPCIRKADGAVGMYDSVDRKFYSNAGGGEFEIPANKTRIVSYDGNYRSLPILEKEGYTFEGWYYSSDSTSLYKFVDYIHFNGTQYINTGFIPNQNTKVSVTFSTGTYANNSMIVYGAANSYNSNAFEFYTWENNFEFNYGTKFSYTIPVPAANKIITAVQDKHNYSITYDGNTIAKSYTTQTFTAPCELRIGAGNRPNTPVTYSTDLKIYECQIWDNGTLIRDMRPCVRNDGTIGMYDLVNGIFFSNAGTGTFTASTTVVDVPVYATTKLLSSSNHSLKAKWTTNSYTLTVDPNGGAMGQNVIDGYFANGTKESQAVNYRINYYIDDKGRIIATGNNSSTSDNYGRTNLNATLTNNTTYVRKMYFSSSVAVDYGWFHYYTETQYNEPWYFSGAGSSGHETLEFTTGAVYTEPYSLRVDPNVYNNKLTVYSTVLYNKLLVSTNAYTKVLPYSTYYALDVPTRNGYVFDGWEVTSGNGTLHLTSSDYMTYIYQQTGAENTIIKAKWIPAEKTVTLDANGGTVNPGSITVTYTSQYGTLPTPSRSGYGFLGWYTQANGGTKVEETTAVTTISDHTIYAQWSPKTYQISYNLDGGALETGISNPISYNAETASFTLNNPTKTGYDFVGWTGSNGKDPQTTVTISKGSIGTRTYSANWHASEYTVTFNAMGGYVGTTSMTVIYDSIYGELPTPTRTGYMFNGWNTKDDGNGTKIEATTIVTETQDHTIYAIWQEEKYNLTLDAGDYIVLDYIESTLGAYIDTGFNPYGKDVRWEMDGHFTSIPNGILGTMGALRENRFHIGMYPNSQGYHPGVGTECGFLGGTDYARHKFMLNSDGLFTIDGVEKWNSSKGTLPNDTIWLFGGNWSGSLTEHYGTFRMYSCQFYEYDVLVRDFIPVVYNNVVGMLDRVNNVFYQNKGSGSFIAGYVQATYDSTYGELPTPTKNGYSFAGWYTEANGGTKIETSTKVSTASDHTLYAHWTANTYSVAINYANNTAENHITVTYDSTMPRITKPARDGYIFEGIYDSPSGGTKYYDNEGYGVRTWDKTEDVTLYAQWTPIKYYVEKDPNGGVGIMGVVEHTYDENKALPENAFTRSYNVTFDANEGVVNPTNMTATYSFAGWNTKVDGTGIAYADKAEVVNLTTIADSTVKLYAQWTPASLNLPTPTREGYEFLGWYTEQNGGTKVDSPYTPTKSTTLYARWEIMKFTITIIVSPTDYGTVSETSVNNVPWGSSITVNDNELTINTIPVVATANEKTVQYTYLFKNWSYATNVVKENLTITANFEREINSYKVKWLNYNGSILKEEMVEYGKVPEIIGTPQKPSDVQYHYMFNGWSPAVEAVTGDAEYTAQYDSILRQYMVKVQPDETGYGTISSDKAVFEFLAYYGTDITVNGNILSVKDVEENIITITATAKASGEGYEYQFNSWKDRTAKVGGNITITAEFIRFAEITIETSGVQTGNVYQIDVYDKDDNCIGTYTETFKLQTDKQYKLIAVAKMNKNDNENKYQVIRIYLDDSVSFSNDSMSKVDVEKTIFNKGILRMPTTIKFEFFGAHFMEVILAKNTIQSISLDIVNDGNDYVKEYESRSGYIVGDLTKVDFVVNSTPSGENQGNVGDSPMKMFIGFKYYINGVAYDTGVNGGYDISYISFNPVDGYDGIVGLYGYNIQVGRIISRLEVQTIESTNISIDIEKLSVISGSITLTSQYGLNKVIDKSTTELILHKGTWIITLSNPEDKTKLQSIFTSARIETDGNVIRLIIN